MAAEHLNAWSPAAVIAAHTALRDRLDAGVGAARITIHDAADAVLGTIVLEEPCGAVDAAGVLTFIQAVREEDAAAGTASYGTLRDGDGVAHRSLPCEAGTEPLAGKIVLNTLTIVAGSPIELVSATVG